MSDRRGDDGEPLSDIECRRQALAGVRDALAGLQTIPAAGLDAEKHEKIRDDIADLRALERSLTNEVDQMEETDDGR